MTALDNKRSADEADEADVATRVGGSESREIWEKCERRTQSTRFAWRLTGRVSFLFSRISHHPTRVARDFKARAVSLHVAVTRTPPAETTTAHLQLLSTRISWARLLYNLARSRQEATGGTVTIASSSMLSTPQAVGKRRSVDVRVLESSVENPATSDADGEAVGPSYCFG